MTALTSAAAASLPTLSATSFPLESRASAVAAQLAGAGEMDAIKSAKLADGAQQFEAMLLEQMLKPLEFGAAPGDDGTDAGPNDTLRTLGTEAMSKAIAKAGGFGLAHRIVGQVTDENRRRIAK